MINETDKREEDRLPSRSFDDRGFAYTCSVKINVGTFFSCLLLDIEIKQLYDVADEIG